MNSLAISLNSNPLARITTGLSSFTKKYGLTLALLVLVASATAMAGTDTTFDTIYTTVKAWAEGSLGKLMAVSAFIIGMGIGLVRQSVIAIVLGLAFALIMFYGPGIMESIVTYAV